MKRIPFTSLMYIIKNYLFKFVKYKYMMQLLKMFVCIKNTFTFNNNCIQK